MPPNYPSPLTFRCSSKEAELLAAAAKQCGISRGALIRSAALAAAKTLATTGA
jgi:uncharacterized protein (DUF1778 family)